MVHSCVMPETTSPSTETTPSSPPAGGTRRVRWLARHTFSVRGLACEGDVLDLSLARGVAGTQATDWWCGGAATTPRSRRASRRARRRRRHRRRRRRRMTTLRPPQYPRCPSDPSDAPWKDNGCLGLERHEFPIMGFSVRTADWRLTQCVAAAAVVVVVSSRLVLSRLLRPRRRVAPSAARRHRRRPRLVSSCLVRPHRPEWRLTQRAVLVVVLVVSCLASSVRPAAEWRLTQRIVVLAVSARLVFSVRAAEWPSDAARSAQPPSSPRLASPSSSSSPRRCSVRVVAFRRRPTAPRVCPWVADLAAARGNGQRPSKEAPPDVRGRAPADASGCRDACGRAPADTHMREGRPSCVVWRMVVRPAAAFDRLSSSSPDAVLLQYHRFLLTPCFSSIIAVS